MFLVPLLFHSYLGLTGTIVLVVALVALQIALRRRRRARRNPGPQEPRATTQGPHRAGRTDNDCTTTSRPSR